jgi:hypothetical protein
MGKHQAVFPGVLQGEVLGPVLFLIFINSLGVQVELLTLVEKIADNRKLGQVQRNDSDQLLLTSPPCFRKYQAFSVIYFAATPLMFTSI